jgi:hypothetical protein
MDGVQVKKSILMHSPKDHLDHLDMNGEHQAINFLLDSFS